MAAPGYTNRLAAGLNPRLTKRAPGTRGRCLHSKGACAGLTVLMAHSVSIFLLLAKNVIRSWMFCVPCQVLCPPWSEVMRTSQSSFS